MNALPFTVSAEAVEFIRQAMRSVPDRSALVGMAPVLSYVLGISVSVDGQLADRYVAGHFSLGWHRVDYLRKEGYREISVSDVTFFVSPEALKRLSGKELILDTVETGVPVRAERTMQILTTA